MSKTQLICPACGQANPESARFCAGCGGTLLPSCPACGAELISEARYCNACGTSVLAAAGGAGRKVVTVLFADLAGSTAWQEALDAESVRAVMARFYEAMRAVIEEHDGRLQCGRLQKPERAAWRLVRLLVRNVRSIRRSSAPDRSSYASWPWTGRSDSAPFQPRP